MIKSKHSGWSYDLQRTPFKGGGIIESIGNAVGDAFSSVGNAIDDAGVFIDKSITQPVNQGLVEADTFVNRELPGGWALPAVIAAAYATGYIDPSLFASEAAATAAAEAGAGTIASEAGSQAFFTALAEGATSADAVAAGLSADAAVGATAGGTGLVTATELAGPTYAELGITGVEGGLAGPTYGELGYTGLNQGQAIASADAASQLAQLKDYASNAKDIYSNVNRAKNIFNTLNNSGQSSTSQALAGALQATQTPMEQFGGLYRMNEKPFLQQQAASISPDSYNVSGQNIASPIAPTNQLLANLLYPKA
jgi:hypothetical protein